MKCLQCGRENPDNAHFCLKCGARLRVTCPECGASLSPEPDLRFCLACGFRLVKETIAPSRPMLAQIEGTVEVRRVVTILFADLAGFTALSERMDPEDVRALQDAYFAAVSKPIETYGGSVEKYIGDAILAVFGAPQAHEDDPERAIHAALAMQAAMAELQVAAPHVLRLQNTQSPDTHHTSPLDVQPTTLQLRIGIHTGLVVSRVGEAGDFVVSGDTVNLAARLQSAAELGTVLVSAETARLTAHSFQMADLGAIPIKGKAEPVLVFRVFGPKPSAPKLRGLPGLTSPLVGRQAEMAVLREALERLKRGIGGIVTVVGEAGIGKSRLVAELRDVTIHSPQFTVHNANWIEGRCLSYGATLPYLLWLDVLRSALGVTLDDAPEVVADRLHAWVQGLCPDRFDAVYPYLARLM